MLTYAKSLAESGQPSKTQSCTFRDPPRTRILHWFASGADWVIFVWSKLILRP